MSNENGTSAIQRRGLMLVLSSPSGAGKTTLSRQLLDNDKQIQLSVSCTTRQKRRGERDGIDYRFVDTATFRGMIERKEFLEYAEVFGNYYGTPNAPVDEALAAGRDVLSWRGQECDPFAEWRVLTVQQAFQEFAGIDLLATAPDPLAPDIALLNAATTAIGIPARDGDRWDDLFFRVFLERIEPRLGLGSPCVLTDYPLSMAALSRPNPDDPRTAERFELYVGGLELANAFGELTDAEAQRARFEADMDLKQQLYGVRYPIDEDFLAALDPDRGGGLPDCSGIALGFDRLVMLATGADHIDDVLWAPVIGTMTSR